MMDEGQVIDFIIAYEQYYNLIIILYTKYLQL